MNYKLTGILIASGYSKRMGKLKALLPCCDFSFINSIILKMSFVCDKIIVVVGHEHELVRNEIKLIRHYSGLVKKDAVQNYFSSTCKKVKIAYNENYSAGMFSSLQKGLLSSENSDWFLYHFVDQPTLPFQFYREFADQVDNNYSWIQPVYKERNSHPIIFNSSVARLILSSGIESNLKTISDSNHLAKKYWRTEYNQVTVDIDTKEDYRLLSGHENSLLTELLKII